MKVYKIYVNEDVPIDRLRNIYDEYFGHVIVANTPDEALEIAVTKGLATYNRKDISVDEIDLTKKGIVLSDFNAG